MKYLQKLLSRQFYRSSLFWILSLLAIYTIGGFFVLPNFINKTIVAQVDQQLGWQAKIEKVEFNPYAFTFAIDNLEITDQQAKEQISFARFYLNFELRSIIEGAFTFADVALVEPKINVELDKNGVSNFQLAQQRQLEKNPPAVEEQAVEETDSPLIKLLFDNINLTAGDINITDNSPAQTVHYQLNPITFNLKNFFTYGTEDSSYHLDVSLGKAQTITWDGSLGIAPVRSNGTLKISGFRVQDFWEYLSEQVPYTLQNALVGITGDYEFSMANEPMQLNIRQATVQIDDIKVANKQQKESFADIDMLNVGPIDFNLAEKKLKIDTVKIDAIDLKVNRNKQGLINLLAPFADAPETVAEADTSSNETTSSEQAFQWSVDNIILNDSQVNFVDQQPANGAEISINKINFDIQGVSQDLAKPLPFNLAYYVDQAGETKINGQVTATPLDLKAHLSLDALALPALQPYISDLAKVNLEQGTLSINGDINFSNDQAGEVQGDFQGAFNIDGFNTKDTVLKQRLVGWQNLAIDPIKVNFNPLSIAINKVAITKPYARLVITEDRSMNLAQLAVNNEPQNSEDNAVEKAPESNEKSTTDEAEEQPIDIKIDNITITDGGAYFADLSMQPPFATSIENINGEINGLSSDNLARADVNITGSIEEYGKMLVKGKINPLSGDLYTDINVDFDKIELSPMTPYSGRYVGYSIDKGKLSLALNYQIANNMLDAKNHVVLDQFTLGQKVQSEEAVKIPLKLALALLTDKDGIIDIKLPITGDMNSPDFAIGGVVMKTLMNLLTKAVTSPFSMMANLVGGSPEKLNSVAFNLGESSLSSDNIEQLNTLAKILKSRPKLVLEVRPMVDQQKDGLALKKQKMQNLLETSGVNNSADQQQRIAILERLLPEYNGATELSTLQLSMQNAVTAASDDPESERKQQVITDEYEQSLQTTLEDKQPLADIELTTLAQQRLKAVKTQLFEQGQVADTQVFALQPSLQGKAQKSGIATIFTLTSN